MSIQSVCALLTLVLSILPVAHANVYKARINPSWSPDGSWMWYRNNLPKGEREFILVDLKKGLRQHAFDHDRLAAALRREDSGEFTGAQLPLENLSFDLEKRTATFSLRDKWYRCNIDTCQLEKSIGRKLLEPAMRRKRKPKMTRGTNPIAQVEIFHRIKNGRHTSKTTTSGFAPTSMTVRKFNSLRMVRSRTATSNHSGALIQITWLPFVPNRATSVKFT